jgi:hypothetical protein
MIQSTITCLHCGTQRKIIEPFFDLSIPIPTQFLPEKIKKKIGILQSEQTSVKLQDNSLPEYVSSIFICCNLEVF